MDNSKLGGRIFSAASRTENYKEGSLPPSAPLAVPFVPFQQSNPPMYSSEDALTRGTLFPGLDLPFMNTANTTNPYAGTPLGELMALDFAINELNLYLDTHPDDADAFAMMKSLIELMCKAKEKYVKMYGPIELTDLRMLDSYTWTDNPWPWDYAQNTGR